MESIHLGSGRWKEQKMLDTRNLMNIVWRVLWDVPFFSKKNFFEKSKKKFFKNRNISEYKYILQ